MIQDFRPLYSSNDSSHPPQLLNYKKNKIKFVISKYPKQ